MGEVKIKEEIKGEIKEEIKGEARSEKTWRK